MRAADSDEPAGERGGCQGAGAVRESAPAMSPDHMPERKPSNDHGTIASALR